MINIVIVDDHPIVRQGLAHLLSQEPDITVCGEAEDTVGAIRVIEEKRPDMVIADLSLHRSSGLELIKHLKSADPRIPVLVLSMHDEAHYVERTLRAGAAGYLTKQEAGAKVVDAVRCVLRGEVYLSEHRSQQMLKRLLEGPTDADPLVAKLSDRELQVFQLVGEGHATQEIADRLKLSIKTIETYLSHIKDKLELRDSRKMTQYAIRWTIERTIGGPSGKL